MSSALSPLYQGGPLQSSVADPDPGSGIGCLLDLWIQDPGSGMGESQHPDPGSGIWDEQPGSTIFLLFWG
jgi:hypothetical protein